MKKITAVYSPICEANGAFIEKLYTWFLEEDVKIEVYSYDAAPKEYQALISTNENCFIEVFLGEKRIDSVPLCRERLMSALDIENKIETIIEKPIMPNSNNYSEEEIRKQLFSGNIEFIPITKETFLEEMSMCLHNYPRENPEKKYHNKCIEIKKAVFNEVFEKESIAGIYAKMNGKVVGLLEAFPREIVKKHGFMTGINGDDVKTLTIACYEVAFGIPRTFMIDELMYHLLQIKDLFLRKNLEGIGIFEWNEGFNPYWVYEKHGFHKSEQKKENMIVMAKEL